MKAICFRITLALTLTLFTMTELVAARPLPAQGTLLWQQTLIGTANGFGQAFSVAVDNRGDVVAVGTSDRTVAKFARDGTLLWQQNLNGTAANSSDQALSVAVDNQGNVLAAGFTQNTAGTSYFTVAKFAR